MSLNRLLPKASKNNAEKAHDQLLYTVMVEWGWSWSQLQETPLPVLLRLLREDKRVKKLKAKQNKKNGSR